MLRPYASPPESQLMAPTTSMLLTTSIIECLSTLPRLQPVPPFQAAVTRSPMWSLARVVTLPLTGVTHLALRMPRPCAIQTAWPLTHWETYGWLTARTIECSNTTPRYSTRRPTSCSASLTFFIINVTRARPQAAPLYALPQAYVRTPITTSTWQISTTAAYLSTTTHSAVIITPLTTSGVRAGLLRLMLVTR